MLPLQPQWLSVSSLSANVKVLTVKWIKFLIFQPSSNYSWSELRWYLNLLLKSHHYFQMRTLLVLTTLWSSSLTGKWRCLIAEQQCYNECLCFKYMTDRSKCITNVGFLFYRDNYWTKVRNSKVIDMRWYWGSWQHQCRQQGTLWAGGVGAVGQGQPRPGQRSVSRSSQLLTTPHQTSPTRFLLPQPRAHKHHSLHWLQ